MEEGVSQSPPTTPVAPSVDVLVQAARDGNLSVVEEQLAAGTDINAFSPALKCTALMAACYENHIPVVRLLLKRHALRDVTDPEGYSAIHWAASSWHDDPTVIDGLLRNGHEELVQFATFQGNTALHRAAAKGNTNIVAYLLRTKALRVRARNDEGQTPADVAVASGFPAIADKIRAAEASGSVVSLVPCDVRQVRCERASQPKCVWLQESHRQQRKLEALSPLPKRAFSPDAAKRDAARKYAAYLRRPQSESALAQSSPRRKASLTAVSVAAP